MVLKEGRVFKSSGDLSLPKSRAKGTERHGGHRGRRKARRV
jgi:hypothetical protein